MELNSRGEVLLLTDSKLLIRSMQGATERTSLNWLHETAQSIMLSKLLDCFSHIFLILSTNSGVIGNHSHVPGLSLAYSHLDPSITRSSHPISPILGSGKCIAR